jgi:hypothetical protein
MADLTFAKAQLCRYSLKAGFFIPMINPKHTEKVREYIDKARQVMQQEGMNLVSHTDVITMARMLQDEVMNEIQVTNIEESQLSRVIRKGKEKLWKMLHKLVNTENVR